MLQIAPMGLYDVSDVYEINEEAFGVEAWSFTALAALPTDEKARYLVARDGDKVLGYMGAYLILDEISINQVAVRGECRRQGVADALVAEFVALAAARRMESMTLEVRESNTAAISLYQKHGFFPEGRRKAFYTDPLEDGIIMTKRSFDTL